MFVDPYSLERTESGSSPANLDSASERRPCSISRSEPDDPVVGPSDQYTLFNTIIGHGHTARNAAGVSTRHILRHRKSHSEAVDEASEREFDVERGIKQAPITDGAADKDIRKGSIGTTVDGTVSDPEPIPGNGTLNFKSPHSRRGYFLYADEPPFTVWLKDSWLDLISFIICGIFSIILYVWLEPLIPWYFPVLPDGEVGWSQLAFPHLQEFVPTWMSALISLFVPLAVIGLVSIFFVGSFWDSNDAVMGLSYALSTSTLTQAIIKWMIGGLRPHFYTVCHPSTFVPGHGHHSIMYSTDICTGDSEQLKAARMSFPSGHSTAAFAGFVFLALWLNAKFKVFADYKTRQWKLVLCTLPILVAALIAASKVADYWHHWYDVLGGALIGTFYAFLGYRQVYYAVWDWRWNHIPLRYQGWRCRSTWPSRDLTALNYGGWTGRKMFVEFVINQGREVMWSPRRDNEPGAEEREEASRVVMQSKPTVPTDSGMQCEGRAAERG